VLFAEKCTFSGELKNWFFVHRIHLYENLRKVYNKVPFAEKCTCSGEMDYSFVHRIHLYKQYITEHYSKSALIRKLFSLLSYCICMHFHAISM